MSAAESSIGKLYELLAGGPDAVDCDWIIYCALNGAGTAMKWRTCEGYSNTEGWRKTAEMQALQSHNILFFLDNEGSIGNAGVYVGEREMIDTSNSVGKMTKRSVYTEYREKHFVLAQRVVLMRLWRYIGSRYYQPFRSESY